MKPSRDAALVGHLRRKSDYAGRDPLIDDEENEPDCDRPKKRVSDGGEKRKVAFTSYRRIEPDQVDGEETRESGEIKDPLEPERNEWRGNLLALVRDRFLAMACC